MTNTMIDTKRKYGKMRKDEYEHVVSTFFDIKKKRFKAKNISVYIIAVVFVLLVSVGVVFILVNSKKFSQSFYISSDKLPLTIAYDFNEAGKGKLRSASFDLEEIDVSRYKYVAFLLRTQNKSRIDSSIRVQIENAFSEKDSKFISGVNEKWQEHSFSLSTFEHINDWSKVKSLTFVIDEWNVGNKKDILHIDEIHFF